jgi:ABC-type phosphate transport system permease subunit
VASKPRTTFLASDAAALFLGAVPVALACGMLAVCALSLAPIDGLYDLWKSTLRPSVWISVQTAFFAILLTVPLALGAAVNLELEGAPWARRLIQLMGLMPAVFWAKALSASGLVLEPLRYPTITACGFLALAVLPGLTTAYAKSLATFPSALHEAARALGASRASTIPVLVVPAVRARLLRDTQRSFARLLGEAILLHLFFADANEQPLGVLLLQSGSRVSGSGLSFDSTFDRRWVLAAMFLWLPSIGFAALREPSTRVIGPSPRLLKLSPQLLTWLSRAGFTSLAILPFGLLFGLLRQPTPWLRLDAFRQPIEALPPTLVWALVGCGLGVTWGIARDYARFEFDQGLLGRVLRAALHVLRALPASAAGVFAAVACRHGIPFPVVLVLLVAVLSSPVVAHGSATRVLEELSHRRTSAIALGATRNALWRHVIFPALLPHVKYTLFAAIARALGSTAAFVIVEAASQRSPQLLSTRFWASDARLFPAYALVSLGAAWFFDWYATYRKDQATRRLQFFPGTTDFSTVRSESARERS